MAVTARVLQPFRGKEISERGSAEQTPLARAVLERWDDKADRHLLARDDLCSRWIKWCDDNRDRLRWDEKAGRYVLESKP